MKLRFLALAALSALVVAAAACSDNNSVTASTAGKIASQTPQSAQSTAATAAATGTIDQNALGPAPVLGGNVISVTPEHGAKITQSQTRSPNPQNPQGLCAQVSFDGLPENAQWFRVAFDGAEVTEKLVWIVKSTTNPTDGRVCYAPAEGFTIGRHSAAIAVQNPRDTSVPTRQIVAWKFDVTP
jgi:hypothetical protein